MPRDMNNKRYTIFCTHPKRKNAFQFSNLNLICILFLFSPQDAERPTIALQQPGAHHVSGGNPDAKEPKMGVALAPTVAAPPRESGSVTSRTQGGGGKQRLALDPPAATQPGAVSVVNSRKASTTGLKPQFLTRRHDKDDDKTERGSEKDQHRLELASSSSPPGPSKGGGGGDDHDRKVAAEKTGLQLAASVGPPNTARRDSQSSRRRNQGQKGLTLAPSVDPAVDRSSGLDPDGPSHLDVVAVAKMVDDPQEDDNIDERIDREANVLVEKRIQNVFEALPEAESFDADEEERKFKTKRRKQCFLLACLAIVVVAVSIPVGILAAGRGSDSTIGVDDVAAPTCDFCFGGFNTTTIPSQEPFLFAGTNTTCSEFLTRQVMLSSTDPGCAPGQAVAWKYCGCPDLPLPPSNNTNTANGPFDSTFSNSSCSLCSDGSLPLLSNSSSISCDDEALFVSSVGSWMPEECPRLVQEALMFCRCPSLRLVQLSSTVLDLAPIDARVFRNTTSFDYQALHWLADQDALQLNASATGVLRQRYALALLFFSTNGAAWDTSSFQYLTDTSVCSWNDPVSQMGVFCDTVPEGTVIAIDLSKFPGLFSCFAWMLRLFLS